MRGGGYIISISPRQYVLLSMALVFLLLYELYKPGGKEIDWSATRCSRDKNVTWGCFAYTNFRLDLSTDVTGTLPYFSGANLVFFADYVFDHKMKNVAPDKMRDGDTVYVKGDYVNQFFRHDFKQIKTKFILMSHNSDASAQPRHVNYLNSDKVIAWFAENPAFTHPKLIPIPIGMENPFYFPEKIQIVRRTDLNRLRVPWAKRRTLLYINFSVKTNRRARQPLIDYFSKFGDQQVVINPKGLDYLSYLRQLGDAKYVLCPRGNGLDTHRFFETVLMGAIPVVENSTLWHTVYRQTTSFVVSDLRLVTIEMLNSPDDTYLTNRDFSRDVMMWTYWEKKINEIKKKYQNDDLV